MEYTQVFIVLFFEVLCLKFFKIRSWVKAKYFPPEVRNKAAMSSQLHTRKPTQHNRQEKEIKGRQIRKQEKLREKPFL